MIDKMVSNELKVLGLETINNAGSGHSGSVLSCGDILYSLYTKHLITNGTKSNLRDRFVLSNGHACAGLYSILAAFGYFDFDELKTFRSYNGMLTGHPEIEIPGIDASTGPLGQGVANAVGMAIAESVMNAKFGLSHYTYCLAGDGCLQEGVALEALSIAGLYKLNRFILLYDKNNITLDGKLSQSSNDDVVKKFMSMNFNVVECNNGHNLRMINEAFEHAKKSKGKPTVIIFTTKIGKDTALEASNKSHGKVYTEQEIQDLRSKYNLFSPKLILSEEAKVLINNHKKKIIEKFKIRENEFKNSLAKNKDAESLYNKYLNNDFSLKINTTNKDMSTRDANNFVLQEVAKTVDNLLVLSADLSSSTKVKLNDEGQYSSENRLEKNIAMGIREHAMGAIANGIALHGGFNVICSTFLTFSNYMMPAIRMAGIMNLPVMFTFSHSSVYDTVDGITHIPVEQLDQLRLMPNVTVIRPANINECGMVYELWKKLNSPICVSLSRGTLPYFDKSSNMLKGAYLLTNEDADIHLLASGSEVGIALEVKECLKNKLAVNVVSVPSIEVFEKQTKQYKSKIFNKPIFVIESGTCVKYLKYTAEQNIFNVCEFGKTGDEVNLKKHFGYDVKTISNKILKIAKNKKI